jgi:hypothetical protein
MAAKSTRSPRQGRVRHHRVVHGRGSHHVVPPTARLQGCVAARKVHWRTHARAHHNHECTHGPKRPHLYKCDQFIPVGDTKKTRNFRNYASSPFRIASMLVSYCIQTAGGSSFHSDFFTGLRNSPQSFCINALKSIRRFRGCK